MRFKRQSKLEYGLQQIDIVPFIDLAFLLLIFFVITVLFTSDSRINVSLPKAVTSDVIAQEDAVITITSENVVYLNGRISTIIELTQELSRVKNNKRSVLIKADRRASVGRIIDVWDLCRNLGIDRINIATNQKH